MLSVSQAVFPHRPITPLPQRVLLVENSRTFTTLLREAIEQRLEMPVSVAGSLAEAGQMLDRDEGWFMVLTGLVLSDGDRDDVVAFFTARDLPTVVVSGVYDEDLRKRVLQQQIIDYVLKNTPGSVDYLVWLVQRMDRNRRISALVVDDSPSARAYATALLRLYGYRVFEAGDGDQALAIIEGDPAIRLVIVDQEMPGMQGVELTRRVRALRSRDLVAVIGISGNSDASLIPRFLKNGANDFLRKPFSREEFFCRVSQNVDQLELIGSLQDLATRDYLTGLPNRRAFLETAQQQLAHPSEELGVLVAMIDIDHFKHINDSLGHDAGDEALRAVANVVHQLTRHGDISARFGGEEFCLLSAAMNPSQARAYLERLRLGIENIALTLGGVAVPLTVSIGGCWLQVRAEPLRQLIAEADRQLYLAKADGRNRVSFVEMRSTPRLPDPA